MALAVPSLRVLLIGAARPVMDAEWKATVTHLPQATHMALPRLGAADLVRLLADSLRSERLAEEIGARIALKSDGNPFFAFEIVRGLREGQLIRQSGDGTWVSTGVIGDIQIPSSVLDLVRVRVADLTEQERDLLDVAACWGHSFDPGLVASALDLPLLPTLKRFGQIERRHRLVRASGRRYVFDHHQVQEALYESLFEPVRELYHAALGDALERRSAAAAVPPETIDGALAADLCEHFLKGASGARALRYLPAAQEHLRHGCLLGQEADLTVRALAVPGLLDGAARARVLLALCEGPLELLGRRADQEEYAREAAVLAADDATLLRRAERSLGGVYWRTGRYDDAHAAFGRCLDLARGSGDVEAEAAATGHLGLVLHARGEHDAAREHFESARSLARGVGARDTEAGATLSIGNILLVEGRPGAAREHYERYLELARSMGDRPREITATANLGLVHSMQGELEVARRHYECGLALSREIGDRYREAHALGALGDVARAYGQLDDAEEAFEGALHLNRQIGNRQGEALRLVSVGHIARERGASAAAEGLYVQGLRLAEAIGWRLLLAMGHLPLGSLRARVGDGGSARGALVRARDLARELHTPGIEALASCELAVLDATEIDCARDALRRNQERLSSAEFREAHFLLWKATADRASLDLARRSLDVAIAAAPECVRPSMTEHVQVHREIVAACAAQNRGGEPGD